WCPFVAAERRRELDRLGPSRKRLVHNTWDLNAGTRLRDNGDTDACGDQGYRGEKIGDATDDSRRKITLLPYGGRMLIKPDLGFESRGKEAFVGKHRRRYRSVLGQLVVAWQRNDDGLSCDDHGRNASGMSRRVAKKPHVEAPFGQLIELSRSLHCRKREAYQWMGPAKFRDRLRHQPRARRCRCVTDFDLPHLASTSKLRDTRGVLGLAQCRSSLLEEARAGVRELHVSLGANEQPRTQFLLEILNLLGQRGGEMWRHSAARVKCNSSATVTK